MTHHQYSAASIGQLIAMATPINHPDLLPCDGRSILAVDYPELNAVLNKSIGLIGNLNSATLPDLRTTEALFEGLRFYIVALGTQTIRKPQLIVSYKS